MRPRARCWNAPPRKTPSPSTPLERELHHEGDLCTFDVIIRKYGLIDSALLRIAGVINAADTDRLGNDPLAAGLEAIAVGYGLRFPDDHENLQRQFEVYDALYAWCRLDIASRPGG